MRRQGQGIIAAESSESKEERDRKEGLRVVARINVTVSRMQRPRTEGHDHNHGQYNSVAHTRCVSALRSARDPCGSPPDSPANQTAKKHRFEMSF